jgi:hypothetical protein
MKKILAISIAIMYLAITSGLVLQIHYCMGRQVGSSIKFADTDTHKCSKCGMQNAKNKCCHDDVKIIKLQDAHKQVTADYQLQAPPLLQQDFNFIDPILLYNTDASEVCNNSPPDDDEGQPSLFILHSVFRI